MKKLKKFIVFEGGEGTGKTTALLNLKEKLKNSGYLVAITREPGGSGLKISEEIRNVIMNHKNIDPITELLLFNASRREHVDKFINPNLEKGAIVISDRFSDSTRVYQGLGRNIDDETIKIANKLATQNIEPDLVFIFDLDPNEGKSRIEKSNRETNRFDFENLDFHNKIRDGYLNIYKENKEKYHIIDASKPKDEIVDLIFEKITKM